MGIGRKVTDQRTPCRKFLATLLLRHAKHYDAYGY